MAGHKKWSAIRGQAADDPDRRQRVAHYKQAMETILSLGEVRAARGVTQTALARRLDMRQPNVSRFEHAEDVQLSTLRDYVAALGGRLEVHAVFADTDDDYIVYADDPERALQR